MTKKNIFYTIKYFSRSKKDDYIRNYINASHKTFEERDGFFIKNKEISVIQLIEDGITKFQK